MFLFSPKGLNILCACPAYHYSVMVSKDFHGLQTQWGEIFATIQDDHDIIYRIPAYHAIITSIQDDHDIIDMIHDDQVIIAS